MTSQFPAQPSRSSLARATLGLALLLGLQCSQTLAAARVDVIDAHFDTAASMLAYTEFELSGEPLAETLGLDLDVLDPDQLYQPTAFDYSAGIESYEYSEEAMYALNYQSRLGQHLANGPRNRLRGGSMASLGQRFIELAKSVGFSPEDMPLHLYPLGLPYESGLPVFNAKPDTREVRKDAVDMLDARGNSAHLQTITPAYLRDFASLGWTESKMQHSLTPAAIGGALLKEVMWSQDFLGGMHVSSSDEEVEATSSTLDQDGKHALGVSSVDGFNGVVLTELSLDKMTVLQNSLGFDGKRLGVAISPDYDASKHPIWFPHRVAVSETLVNGVKQLGDFKITDGASHLRDSWMLLWPLSEYFAFSDQRQANSAQNPAFRAVFDGSPFAATPAVNTDANSGNDVAATDAFSLASNLSNLVFRNLLALHFDAKAGTLVDRYDGHRGSHISTYDAAYSLVALSIFQRAQDALPVGYAAAAGGALNLHTAQGKQALQTLTAQADFILTRLVSSNGLVFDGYDQAAGEADPGQSLDAQFAAIRGLSTAFVATGDAKYRLAARQIYLAVDKQLYDPKLGTWAAQPGKPTEQTPWTAAAISSGLRSAMLNLKNSGSETAPALELVQLTQRYSQWFHGVINGATLDQGMQQAEWIGDSGEHVLANGNPDADADHVPQIVYANKAVVLAARVRVSAD